MVNFLALWNMIRAVGPAFYLMAAAFKHGTEKYGDGTWRDQSPVAHLEAALKDIVAWRNGDVTSPLLVDAALRVVFAVAVAISQGDAPKEYSKK